MSHVVASTLSLLSRGVIFKFPNDFDYSSIDFNNNTVKSHLKPWASITSKGVLGGLINGGGAYIRVHGLISGTKKYFGTTR